MIHLLSFLLFLWNFIIGEDTNILIKDEKTLSIFTYYSYWKLLNVYKEK